MRMPFKAPRIKLRPFAAKGFYWTVLPLGLVVLSLVLFGVTALLHGVWNNGWLGAGLLLALCFETFFLPYFLLPLATRLPKYLPWPGFDPALEFDVRGEGKLAQRILLAALILLPGLPVLAAYDSHIMARATATWYAPFEVLLNAGLGTIAVFAVLAAVLAIPDFGGEASDH